MLLGVTFLRRFTALAAVVTFVVAAPARGASIVVPFDLQSPSYHRVGVRIDLAAAPQRAGRFVRVGAVTFGVARRGRGCATRVELAARWVADGVPYRLRRSGSATLVVRAGGRVVAALLRVPVPALVRPCVGAAILVVRPDEPWSSVPPWVARVRARYGDAPWLSPSRVRPAELALRAARGAIRQAAALRLETRTRAPKAPREHATVWRRSDGSAWRIRTTVFAAARVGGEVYIRNPGESCFTRLLTDEQRQIYDVTIRSHVSELPGPPPQTDATWVGGDRRGVRYGFYGLGTWDWVSAEPGRPQVSAAGPAAWRGVFAASGGSYRWTITVRGDGTQFSYVATPLAALDVEVPSPLYGRQRTP